MLKKHVSDGVKKAFFPLKAFKVIVLTLLTILSAFLIRAPVPTLGLPGSSVDSPTNLWAPYGPRVGGIQYNYYATETNEFQDFLFGHLDLTDWPLGPSQYAAYDNNPDFLLSPGQGQFGMFGIDFNYGSSTWASWGCDWQHGNSGCGIEIREAFAHLLDRQSFVKDGPLSGAGQALADPSPAAKDPSGSPLATQQSWDTLTGQTIAGMVVPPEASAFNVAPSSGGFAAMGSPDFCVARDHLIAAGIGLTDNNMDCVIDSSSPGLANIIAHPIRFMIRGDDPNRKVLGTGLTNAINQLFGTTVVQPFVANIAQLAPIVFTSAPQGATDDWDMYTSGWSLTGPFPDHLTALHASVSASDQCGGLQNGFTQNYGFVCVPAFDNYVNAASQTVDLNVFKSNTLSAFNEFGKRALDIPVYSKGIRIAALRSVAGLVNMRGVSYPNFFTLLDAHNDTTYTPVNPIYSFGGGTNILRWGQRQGTTQLNPFNAETLWEANVIGEVYDTLLAPSPVEPASIMCWMCDSYTTSVDSQGNTHFRVELRQNLRWQDGPAVNASDVKFSLLNMRDVPAASFAGNLQQLLTVTILSSTQFDIKMQGQSLSHPINLASVPIIPRHIWELAGDKTYGDVGKANPAMTSISYDVINAGTFIGSGPFMCKSVFSSDQGKVGTGCSRNADGSRGGQALSQGGSLLLQTFDRTSEPGNTDPFLQYMRSYNPNWGTGTGTAVESGQYQEFRWADRFGNATVTIRDLASVAACNGKTSASGCADYSYWLRPALHPSTPNTIGSEVTLVASHLDDTWVAPYSWSGVASNQPGQTLENITPFS